MSARCVAATRFARLVAALPFVTACAAPAGAVRQFGGMREVMRDGQSQARVTLRDLAFTDKTIAVGALTGIDGEITIAGDEVHLTTATDGTPRDARAIGDQTATLLTIATPTISITQQIDGALDEATLERRCKVTNLDGVLTLDIRGTASNLELHVARGSCPHGVTTEATAPWRWSAPTGAEVRLVGFYAPGQAGVMTHHGTAFHLHAIRSDATGTFAGHVDSFELQPGATVTIGGRR